MTKNIPKTTQNRK